MHVELSRDDIGDATRKLLALWREAMPEVAIAPKSVVPATTQEREPVAVGGISLAELWKRVKSGQKPPQSLIFPDGHQEKDLEHWRDILIATAKWTLPKLQINNKLPLNAGRKAGRYLIHSIKGEMPNPRPLTNSWWVEVGFDAKGCVSKACYLLEQAGVNPEDVKVTF